MNQKSYHKYLNQSMKVFLPEVLPLLTCSNEGWNVPEYSSPILHDSRGLAPEQLDQEDQGRLLAADVALVLLAVSGQVPERGQDHFQRGLVLPVRLHWRPHRGLHQGPGAHRHGRQQQHVHHLGLGQDWLGGLVRLPRQIPEQVGRGLPQVLPVALQLVHHDLNEPREGAEVRLDAGVAEGEVRQGHHGVPPHLPTLRRIAVGKMGLVFNLEYLPTLRNGK